MLKPFRYAIAVVVLGMQMMLPMSGTAIAQADACNDLPGLELTQSIASSGSHGIWLLAKKETPTAKAYVKVNQNGCEQVAIPKSNDWEWVSGTGGIIKQNLSVGTHTFKFSVDGGAILIDKILVTTDTNCDPNGNGQNCIEEPIDFVIEGIEQGSTVVGERKISSALSIETNDPVAMEFSIDGKSIAKQTEKPYCLIESEAGACGLYNLTTLGEGKHTLSVAATTAGGQYVTKSVEFTVGKVNAASPTVGVVAEKGQESIPDPLTITVNGLKEGETVRGKRRIDATVAGATGPVQVLFALNGNDFSASDKAPYCLIQSEETCAEWNSETVTNGDYVLFVRATSAGVKTKETVLKFNVSNSVFVASSFDDDKEIIVGNTNQKVSGKVRVRISPKKLRELKNIQKIIYKINGEVIGEATISNPTITLDTTKYRNKKYRITAVLGAYNGETTDLNSEVEIQNDVGLAMASWLKENTAVAGGISLATVVLLFLAIRFVSGRLKYRKLLREHNLIGAGQPPSVVHGHVWHAGYALTSIALVAGVGLSIFRIGISEAGVGTGFVDEVENGKPSEGFAGLSLGYEGNMTIAFARLSYARPVTSPDAPTTPSPAANGDGFVINTASTGFEAETMDLASPLGRAVPDTSAHGVLSLLIWGNGSAYKTVNSVAINGLTVRARADLCNGAPTMIVKMDGVAVMTTSVQNTTWTDYSVPVIGSAGAHSFEIQFTNDEFSSCDRNLYVDTVALLSSTIASTVTAPSSTSTTTTPQTTPIAQAATEFTQNFNSGTNASTVNMADLSGGGPHSPSQAGKIVVRDGRVNADPNTTLGDTYAVANYNFTADQFAEADLIIGSSGRGQYTGVNVRANTTGPNYSWYKLETVDSSTQLRILTLKDNRIAAEYYANIPGGINANTTYRLRLEVVGNTLRGYINGSALKFTVNGAQTEAVVDNFITNGKAGLNIYGSQSWLDNFKAGNIGNGNVAAAPTPTTPAPTPTPAPAPTPTTTAPQTHTGMMQHNGMGPMIDNNRIPGPFPAMQGPVLWSNTGYVPFADDIGAFRTDCTVSHISYDDPIVFPGRPGGAHLHTFFGNSGVNAFSTQQSIETTGGSTCSGGTLNRTGYWMPTVIDGAGVPVMPERVLVYYKTSYYGVSAQSVIAPPPGLRMIAGTGSSTTVQAKDPYGKGISSFACNSESFPYPVVTGGNSIDTFCPEGARQLFMEIRFPQCWDGRNLDSFDHKSHMAYPTGYGCPSSHPLAIAEIQLRVKYNYYADRSSWKLSSDNYNGPGGYSSHADWYNGWDRATLDKITRNCWNAQRDCQVDNIGNGEKLGRQ